MQVARGSIDVGGGDEDEPMLPTAAASSVAASSSSSSSSSTLTTNSARTAAKVSNRRDAGSSMLSPLKEVEEVHVEPGTPKGMLYDWSIFYLFMIRRG